MKKKPIALLSLFIMALFTLVVLADPDPTPPQIPHNVPGTQTGSSYSFTEGGFFGGGSSTIQHWIFYFSAPLADYVVQQAKIVITSPPGDPIEQVELGFAAPWINNWPCSLLVWSPETGLYDSAGLDIGASDEQLLGSIDWLIFPHKGHQTSRTLNLELYAIWRCPFDLTNNTFVHPSSPDTRVNLDVFSNITNNLSRESRYRFPQFEPPFGWNHNRSAGLDFNTSNQTQIPDEKLGFLFGEDEDQKYAVVVDRFDKTINSNSKFLSRIRVYAHSPELLEGVQAYTFIGEIKKSMEISDTNLDTEYPYLEFFAWLPISNLDSFIPEIEIQYPDETKELVQGTAIEVIKEEKTITSTQSPEKINKSMIIIFSLIIGLVIGYWLAKRKKGG